jgi:hypothetical protein
VPKRWTVVRAGIAGAVIGIAVAAAWAGRPYTSTAVLRLNPPMIPEHFVPSQRVDLQRVSPYMMMTILSRHSLANLINTYTLYADEQRRMPLEDVIERMRGSIRISYPQENMLQLSFSYRDRYLAQKVTVALVSRFFLEWTRERVIEATLTRQFLTDRAEAAAIKWESRLQAVRQAQKSGQGVDRARLDADIARSQYESLSGKVAEAQTIEEMEQRQQGPKLEMVDTASLPVGWRPPIWLGAVVGVLAGAVAGWGASHLTMWARRQVPAERTV